MTAPLNPPSLDRLSQVASRTWDAIVIGAGVAGASLAIHLARNLRSVLLVEAQAFPREKVCGGCLNPRAQHHLEDLGIASALLERGAVPIDHLEIHAHRHRSRWNVPRMLSVRRSTLDTCLVDAATQAGAHFLPETTAHVLDNPSDPQGASCVSLAPSRSRPGPTILARGTQVVVAAGLSRSPLPRSEPWTSQVDEGSRVGVQCLLPEGCLAPRGTVIAHAPRDNLSTLQMLIGPAGYAGICRTDGGYLDVAAALDPREVRRHGSIGECVQALLAIHGWQGTEVLSGAHWLATPLLTRQSLTVAHRNVFLLGDSAGYVEPFTGEGMSWALEGSAALASILDDESNSTPSEERPRIPADRAWTAWVQSHRRRQQSVSKWVARQARHRRRSVAVLTAMDWLPPLRNYLLRKAMK